MASALSKRAAASASSFFRFSFNNFFRDLSTASTTATSASAPAGSGGGGAVKKSKRKKKKNLIEVAHFLPDWGIGYHMAKTHWTNVSYQITKINLYKDGRHGKAWGIAHKDGLPIADAAKKISGVHKRCWRYLPNSKRAEESPPAPNLEVQAA